ncbi:uncharacterized protein PRCAT00003085001 [Priceomyces carsonii]|uniref:uncharacterized protein n=1 Tax=Priceomyces carsonii TaxID=28549 RepID=UPI002EDAA05F|nr:unnamed protein product [Priceomyces carsonii]
MKVEIVRKRAYLDISIGGLKTGRIVLELYDDLAPKASRNFIDLCTSTSTRCYKGTCFHRVIKNFMVQSGDWMYGKDLQNYPNDKLGSLYESFDGSLFEGENLEEPINEPFKLCMANNGDKNCNGSQFFINTFPQPHLNGKHTVFGRVLHGKSVVREMERVNTDSNNFPVREEIILIEDCGEWEEGMDVPIYNASYDQIGGDIFEEYPDDDTHIDKESSESVYKAAVKIKESGNLLLKGGDKINAYFKYRKCLRYVMEYIPDEDQEPEWFRSYSELKKKIYLNLSLVCLQLKNYKKGIDYSTFLLETDGISEQESAKAYFRRGSCNLQMRKYENAIEDLKNAQKFANGDHNIEESLKRAQKSLEERNQKEKSRYAKFFQ